MKPYKIIKSQNHQERAFHHTDIPPTIVLKEGLSKKGSGYTSLEVSDIERFIPENHIYVSKMPSFSDYVSPSKYIYEININGLKKYPDFGTFPSTGAYLEENSMWWKRKDIENVQPESLKEMVAQNNSELKYSQVTGENTWEWFGTATIEAPIPPSRISLYEMKSAKSAYKNLYKQAQIYGEWWFIDGNANYADSDIGDKGHEGYVLEHILAYHDINPEKWEKWEVYFDKIPEEILRKHGMGNEEIAVLKNMIDPRIYGIKNLGWKRVTGRYIETWTLTTKDLEEIANGLYDAYALDGEAEDELNEETFMIEVRSTNMVFNDVPYSVIESGNPSSLLQYRGMTYANHKNWYKKSQQLDLPIDTGELNEDNIYEQLFEGREQAIYDVLQEFKKRKKKKLPQRQPWQVVPFNRVQKIWQDYARYGMVRDDRGIDNIAAIMINNVHRLHANTYLMGHTPYDPSDSFEKHGIDPESEEFSDFLIDEEQGQWRISDFALDELENDACELAKARTSEQKLLIIDRMFNRVHRRSDLAAMFIEGGQQSLNRLFEGDKPLRGLLGNSNNWYKISQAQDMFDTSTTGMPYYDDMIQNPEYFKERKHKQFEMVYMSPEEYIDTIGQGFWQSISPQSKQDYKNYQDMIQQRPMTSLIEKYMKVKDKFPMPVIEYNSDGQMISQEGHHRAIVAQNRGIKSIPVMIISPKMNWYKLAESKYEMVQKLKNQQKINPDWVVDFSLPLKWTMDFKKITGANPLPHFIWIYKKEGFIEGEPLPITQKGKDLLIQYQVNKKYPLKLAQSFGKEEPHNKELQELTRNLEAQYPGLDLYAFICHNGYLELSQLQVPKELQNQGIGTKVVQTIKNFAQNIGLPVVLRPEAEPRKKKKLDDFYRNLGFIPNKGRNKDYKLSTPFAPTMYWKPQKTAQVNAYYIGNCTNSFDPNTGESKIDAFVDVSDFANKDENAIELGKEDFDTFVPIIPPQIEQELNGHELKYLFYNGNIFVIYDLDSDVHYFFRDR